MKLFLISQDVNVGYETYDSAVVVADSESDAREMHPYDGSLESQDGYGWLRSKDRHLISVKYLGETTLKSGIVCASYNAG